VILRCTARALALLAAPRAGIVQAPESEDDWYANVLWIDRRKCLLLMHAGTLFPVLVADVRAPAWRPVGPPLVAVIESALAREWLATSTLGALDPAAVRIARTASRRTLGFMNETARMCRHGIERAGGLEHTDINDLNRGLCRLLHNREGAYYSALDCIAQRGSTR